MSAWRQWTAVAAVAVLAAGVLAGTASPGAASPGVVAIPTGTYLIKNDASGQSYCLQMDPRGFPFTQGPLVGMVICNPNSAFQLWQITPVVPQPVAGLELYFVRNAANGGCLDADNRSGRLTWVVHVIPCHGGSSNPWQMWTLPTGSGTIWALALAGIWGLDNSQDVLGGFGQRVNYWPLSSTYNAKQVFSIHRHPSTL